MPRSPLHGAADRRAPRASRAACRAPCSPMRTCRRGGCALAAPRCRADGRGGLVGRGAQPRHAAACAGRPRAGRAAWRRGAAVRHLPPPRPGHHWDILADSADPSRGGRAAPAPLAPRCVLWCAETPDARAAPGRRMRCCSPNSRSRRHRGHVARHRRPPPRRAAGDAAQPSRGARPAGETAAQARDSLARRRAAPHAAADPGRCHPAAARRHCGIAAQWLRAAPAADQGIGD